MRGTTRPAETAMSEEMKSLLAPTIDSGSTWRDLFLLPLAALLLAMLIGALTMIATSVAPATILQSFIAMARGALAWMHALSETVTAAIPPVPLGSASASPAPGCSTSVPKANGRWRPATAGQLRHHRAADLIHLRRRRGSARRLARSTPQLPAF